MFSPTAGGIGGPSPFVLLLSCATAACRGSNRIRSPVAMSTRSHAEHSNFDDSLTATKRVRITPQSGWPLGLSDYFGAAGIQRIRRDLRQRRTKLLDVSAAAIAQTWNLQVLVQLIEPRRQVLARRVVRTLFRSKLNGAGNLGIASLAPAMRIV